MKAILSVNKEVVNIIKKEGYVNAITDFKNPYSEQAYKLLKEKSKMDNFFFAFHLENNNIDEDIKCNIPNNDYILILNIPDTERIFSMPYYYFSDLIYYFDNASIEELKEQGYKTIEITKNHCMTGRYIVKNQPSQINFQKIQNEWIEKIYEYDKFM